MERRKGNIDMISGLPDEILHHILSFLPTKLSVQTSVLAKRWRFLWALVPNLEFHGNDHWGQRKKMKHLDIIERVISLHEAKTLNSFRVSNVKGCSDRLEALIIYAVERSVRNLYLDFGYVFGYLKAIPCGLPRLLACKSLVELKLGSCGVIPSSGELFLPSLKKLDLRNVDYEDKESLPHLLSGCPVLEELIVKEAFWEKRNNLDCIIVSSPTITTLNVQFSPSHEVSNDEMLTIDVPALVYLKVYGCHLDYAKSLAKTMAYLIEAEIHLNGNCHDCDIDCSKCDRTIAFISSLCHVKYLKISYYRPQKQIVDISRMPRFVNLTKLRLDLIIDWHNLVMFLHATDNLEVLLFKAASMSYTEPKRVPTSMLSRLRTVTVASFDYRNEGGFDMVRYILRNAQVLKRMVIHPYGKFSDEEKLDAQRRISLFERGSKSCQCQLTFNVRSRNVMC